MIDSPRGSNKIHKALFVTETYKEKSTKGRSAKLITRRNESLLYRYLYHGRASKRFDIILKELSTEFFLSETTIADLLNDNFTQLQSLKNSYKEFSEISFKKHLQKKWPYQNWAL